MAGSRNDRGRTYLLGLIGAALFVVILLVVLGLNGRNGGGEDDDDRWQDLSKFKGSASDMIGVSYYEAGSPLDLKEIADPGRTLYFLIGIEDGLTSDEVFAIRDFVQAGGKVVVADDGMNANDLGHIPGGDSVRYESHKYLVQPRLGETDPGFVVNSEFVKSSANIGGRNFDLILHGPLGLNHSASAYVWLRTTKLLTVVDLNDNGVQELSDRYAPYGAIAVGYPVGSNGGSIVYFSTTGLFTDNVFDLADNEGFVRNFINMQLLDGGNVLLDQSKQESDHSPHLTALPEG